MYRSLSIGILLLSFAAAPLGAAPQEITLYRQAARVTELTKVRFQPAGKQLQHCLIIISGQADPASFQAIPLGNDLVKIEDIAWRRLPKEDDADLKARRRTTSQLKETKNGLLAELEGIESQLQFWQQQTKAKAKTPAEAALIATNIGRNTKKAFLQKLSISEEITLLNRRIKQLDEEVNASDSAAQALWEGTITVSGTAAPLEVLLSYSYTLSGCGWRPVYRLDAVIPENKIKFNWEAEVWQNSGVIWQDVDLRLAVTPLPSVSPSMSFTPPSPFVDPDTATHPKRSKSPGKKKPLPSLATGEGNDAGAPSPSALPGGFPLQQVVKTTLPSGLRKKIILQEENWPAAFDYLARPDNDSPVYLQAQVRLSVTREIPRGEAVFFRNGSFLHRGEFVFSGQQESIIIGQDPLVSLVRSLSPEKNERLWRWEAQNNQPFPIKMRIETSIYAAAGDVSQPAPAPVEEKPGLWVWTLGLQAGEKKIILDHYH